MNGGIYGGPSAASRVDAEARVHKQGPAIVIAEAGPSDLPVIRDLLSQYAADLRVDLSLQQFDAELAGLPGPYAPPHGRLIVARKASTKALGCIALRPLGTSAECEIKRLFVKPRERGLGFGRALLDAAVTAADRIGYSTVRLDTLTSMSEAIALYERRGFQRTGPYYAPYLPGTLFMARDLRAGR